jgi:hypothetical protein
MDEEKTENMFESVSLQVDEDAVPLCPNCLEPCDPLDNYCQNCDSNEAINPLASYMPFTDLRFRVGMIGKLWRKLWSPETAIILRVLYIFILLLFFPAVFLIMLPASICYKHLNRKNRL